MDGQFDLMMRMLEKLVDSLSLDNVPVGRDPSEPQVTNLNYRRTTFPCIRQMIQTNWEDQHIQRPFLENYVENEESESCEEYIV